MIMESIKIAGELRKPGKKFNKDLRKNGFLPVVIYGSDKDVLHVACDANKFAHIYSTYSTFFSLVFEVEINDIKELVLIKDYDLNPVTNVLRHLDFQRLPINNQDHIKIKVALFFENVSDSSGVKSGGMLLMKKRFIFVECEADSIINELIIDAGNLLKNDEIRIKDLCLPKGVRVINYKDTLIAKIVGGRSVEKDINDSDDNLE